MPTELTVEQLALKIADRGALSAIDGGSLFVSPSDHGCGPEEQWYDIADLGDGYADDVRYLELRGLLERHPSNPKWVQLFEEVEEPADAPV